jgi:hypothetical protein
MLLNPIQVDIDGFPLGQNRGVRLEGLIQAGIEPNLALRGDDYISGGSWDFEIMKIVLLPVTLHKADPDQSGRARGPKDRQ